MGWRRVGRPAFQHAFPPRSANPEQQNSAKQALFSPKSVSRLTVLCEMKIKIGRFFSV
jgi:hypothetical protein